MKQWKNKGRDRGLDIQNNKIVITDEEDEEQQQGEQQQEEEQLDMPRRSPSNTETLVADPRVIPSGDTLAEEIAIHMSQNYKVGSKH